MKHHHPVADAEFPHPFADLRPPHPPSRAQKCAAPSAIPWKFSSDPFRRFRKYAPSPESRRAPISGTGTSSSRTSLTPRYTAAFIVAGIRSTSFSTVTGLAISIQIYDFLHPKSACRYYRGCDSGSPRRCVTQVILGLNSACSNSLSRVPYNSSIAAAQHPARPPAIPRQHNRTPPQAKVDRNMKAKSRRPKLPVARNKSFRGRHGKIRGIGNRFQRAKLDPACLRSLRHRRRFHINRDRPYASPNRCFWTGPPPPRNSPAFPAPVPYPFAHHPRHSQLSAVPKPPPPSASHPAPRKSNRNDPPRMRFLNHRLGSSPRRLCSNPATNQNRITRSQTTGIAFRPARSLEPSSLGSAAPLPAPWQQRSQSERRDLAGTDRFKLVCRRLIAVRRRRSDIPIRPKPLHRPPQRPSTGTTASPTPAPPSPNSQTSSCVPSGPHQSSPAARVPANAPLPSHRLRPSPAQTNMATSPSATSTP